MPKFPAPKFPGIHRWWKSKRPMVSAKVLGAAYFYSAGKRKTPRSTWKGLAAAAIKGFVLTPSEIESFYRQIGRGASRNPAKGINDRERELWVQNDEGLYNWWKGSHLPLREFIRQNRAELTAAIQRALNVKPRSNTVTRMRAIDVTPTWTAIMPGLIRVLCSNSATEKSKSDIVEELMRLAKFADGVNARVKK